MGCPFTISGAFSAGDGFYPQFYVHVFMYSQGTQNNACSFQVGLHHPIAVNSIVFMIDLFNLILDALFFFLIRCLAVLSIVIVSVWIDIQSAQQPTDAEKIFIIIDKSVSP